MSLLPHIETTLGLLQFSLDSRATTLLRKAVGLLPPEEQQELVDLVEAGVKQLSPHARKEVERLAAR